ncbi:sugar transferase [Planctomycetaceae bacterium SH139]
MSRGQRSPPLPLTRLFQSNGCVPRSKALIFVAGLFSIRDFPHRPPQNPMNLHLRDCDQAILTARPTPKESGLIEAADARVYSTEEGPLVWRSTPFWKRCFDIVFASIVLIAISPLLIAITIFIRLVSPGPALFKQSRIGGMGEDFVIFKFRTMHPRQPQQTDSEHRAYVADLVGSRKAAAKPQYGHRLIPCGHFLRAHSLDELPQLLNVIRGDMSLIGPRPDVLSWEDYPPWQRHRFEVLPGITGLWQVSGKNALSFDEMVELDLEYIQRRSIKLDAWILVKTVRLLLSGQNN